MRIGVLGTGSVGRTLAAGLSAAGHDVAVGTRDVASTMGSRPTEGGAEAYAAWAARHPGVGLLALPDAAAHGDVVVNALNGQHSVAGVRAAGVERLDGTVLLDVANVLDFSQGFPPRVGAGDTSLAERLQAAVPGARVVKALNTVTAPLMVDPGAVASGEHTVFVCGDDADAKTVVRRLLGDLGWSDVLDLGPLSAARATEAYLGLWLATMQALGTPMFNVRVVR